MFARKSLACLAIVALFAVPSVAEGFRPRMKLSPRQESCPANAEVCSGDAGSSCYDPNAGDTCCASGGMCNIGTYCGTGENVGYCCDNGLTADQCFNAGVDGTATAPGSVPTATDSGLSNSNGAAPAITMGPMIGYMAAAAGLALL